ncbi:MAG: hypothetical protein ACE5IO_10750 [Thermoplasmata archaeon]
MRDITELNITGREQAAFNADLGAANEFLVTGILIRLGFDVGVMQIDRLPYDLWLRAFEAPNGAERSLRVEVKTVSQSGSLKLFAGTRGGRDRITIPGVTEYEYTLDHNDLIIGVEKETFDLYLVPTCFAEQWGRTKSVRLLQPLKNNWDLLLNWNREYLLNLAEELNEFSALVWRTDGETPELRCQ